MTEPVFAVIIPTFNRAGFIRKTIESVLGQTFSDFELIVVDDGSQDNTSDVVRGISDDRLQYHFKDNEERAAARNAGTKLARARYVTFLDSDDLLYPDHLAAAAEMIEKYTEPEFFHLGYEFQDSLGGRTRQVDSLPEVANDSLIDGNALSCRGVFLRRDIATLNLFNQDRELSGTEGYELWLRLASRYPLYCDNRITSAMVQHDDRSVVNADKDKLLKRIDLLEKYLYEDDKFDRRFGQRKDEFEANNRVYIALTLALSGHRRKAVSYLGKALARSPKALKNRAFYGTVKRLFLKYND